MYCGPIHSCYWVARLSRQNCHKWQWKCEQFEAFTKCPLIVDERLNKMNLRKQSERKLPAERLWVSSANNSDQPLAHGEGLREPTCTGLSVYDFQMFLLTLVSELLPDPTAREWKGGFWLGGWEQSVQIPSLCFSLFSLLLLIKSSKISTLPKDVCFCIMVNVGFKFSWRNSIDWSSLCDYNEAQWLQWSNH